MGMASYHYTNPPYYHEKDRMEEEINELKDVVNTLTREINEMKKLLSARASFTDFKVFKFNEEEELRKQKELLEEEERRRHVERMSRILKSISR